MFSINIFQIQMKLLKNLIQTNKSIKLLNLSNQYLAYLLALKVNQKNNKPSAKFWEDFYCIYDNE